MNPIQPVGTGGSAPISNEPVLSSGGTVEVGGAQSSSSIVQSSSMSFTSVNTSVTQMLQSIGGGVENDQMLKMLIGLMILLSLLGSQQEEGEGGSQSQMGQMGMESSSQSQYVGIFASSTTVSMQQSSTTMISSSDAGMSMNNEGAPAEGSNIDVSG